MSDMNSPTSQVALSISRGKEQGYLTYAEVNDTTTRLNYGK